MASKVEILNKTYNQGQKDFRFTLSEASEGTLILYHSPSGWNKSETTYTRHSTYKSVLRNTSTNELTFYKEGRDFIKNVYENSGIDANITFTVEKLSKTTYEYEAYPSANKVDLSTYMVNEVGVSVQLIDTQFKEKLINRDSTEVDILKRVTIEGLNVALFTVDEVTMPDTSIDLSDTATVDDNMVTDGDQVIGITAVTNADFTEMQVPTGSTINTIAASFFKESTRPRIVHLTGDNNIDIWGTYANFTIVHLDGSGNVLNNYGINESNYTGADPKSDTITLNVFITLAEDDSLVFQVNFTGTRLLISGEIIVSEIYTGSPETDLLAYPYYETFLRIGQLITDTDNPFKSDYFGRTDTPLTTYGSDGEIGFITKGIFFRSSTGGNSYTIPLKLKDTFESLSNIFRLGLGVETIGGVDKFVIEDLDYFFDSTVVLDIEDKLRVEDIEKSVIPEMFYKSCETGFNKFTYEFNAGLMEFNTKASWTTIIKTVFNDFKKIVKIRGDGQAMRAIMLAPTEDDYDSTKDVKGDSNIFLIDALRDGAGGFIARTDEGFDYVGGSVYASSSFNLMYSPARNLRRWGADIKAGLIHALNTYLRWQSTEKNTTLESRLTTETLTVKENEDILVNDLTANRWYNEKYTIKAPLTTAQLNAVDANPNGLVKLSTDKYGWILSLKTSNEDGMTEMELLRCNLNEVTPI